MKILILLLALAAPACAETLSLPAAPLAPFAALIPAKAAPPTPALVETPAKLKDTKNREAMLTSLGVKLTPAEEAYLDLHRFLVLPKARTRFAGQVRLPKQEAFQWDEMCGMFDELSGEFDPTMRKPENVKLITPDIALHTFHKLLENALEQAEITELGAALRQFVTGLRGRLVAAGKDTGGDAGARLTSLGARILVAEAILETAEWSPPNPSMEPDKPVPADDRDTVKAAQGKLDALKAGIAPEDLKAAQAELELIFAADKTAVSPLFGFYSKEPIESDYTQFRPRSHYTKKSALRAYFRAMMYLGRSSWLFETDRGLGDALLITWAIAGPAPDKKPLLEQWTRIMEVTGFFAGTPDDVSYPSFRDWAVKVLGDAPLAPAAAISAENVAKLRAKLAELAPPRILSDTIADPAVTKKSKDDLLARTKGFRVFGQRFTLDGWVMGQIAAGKEKIEVRLPGVPSVAGLAAMFGDKTARGVAGDALAAEKPPFTSEEVTKYLAYVDQIGQKLAKTPEAEWYVSISAAWLRVLSRLTGTFGQGYPLYMQSPEFPLRQLAAFAGSYAELKHDTLLYAKPNYAEAGGGGEETEPPPVPRGLVEPNLPFWRDLERLTTYFRDGLITHGIMPGEKEQFSTTTRFVDAIAFFAKMAEQQLAGQKPTDDDLEKLRTTSLSEFARPWGDVILEDDQLRSGLIADIHTDADSGRILYEATAEPQVMLTILSADGPPRLAVGVVYNPVEFTGPTGTRLSDQDWHKRVYTDKPDVPASRLRAPVPEQK